MLLKAELTVMRYKVGGRVHVGWSGCAGVLSRRERRLGKITVWLGVGAQSRSLKVTVLFKKLEIRGAGAPRLDV